jgi:hypothetical protein
MLGNLSNVKRVRPEVDIFWAELTACDHCVQIYETDDAFLDALEAFAAGGIRQGDAIVVIATPAHLDGLKYRLTKNGFDLAAAIKRDQFIALDASATLDRFLVDGWPDDTLFKTVVDEVLARAEKNHRRVRAFGEMVALMWADGHCAATVRLEHLWNRICIERGFSLFCAYPKTGFTEKKAAAMQQICAAHSAVYAL